MKLAPRMIQSMEILQLPILALQERIEQELNSNPVLEIEEPSSDDQPQQTEQPQEDLEAKELVIGNDSQKIEDFQRLDSLDVSLRRAIWLQQGEFYRQSSPMETDRRAGQ